MNVAWSSRIQRQIPELSLAKIATSKLHFRKDIAGFCHCCSWIIEVRGSWPCDTCLTLSHSAKYWFERSTEMDGVLSWPFQTLSFLFFHIAQRVIETFDSNDGWKCCSKLKIKSRMSSTPGTFLSISSHRPDYCQSCCVFWVVFVISTRRKEAGPLSIIFKIKIMKKIIKVK